MPIGPGRKRRSDRVYPSQSVYFKNPDTLTEARQLASRIGMSFSEFVEDSVERRLEHFKTPEEEKCSPAEQ
jgi:hypothetical protein